MNFTYKEPSTLREAVQMMEEVVSDKKRGIYLAGGSDLFPLLKRDVFGVDTVINLKRIYNMDEITEDDEKVTIGALVSLHTISRSGVIEKWAPAVCGASDRAATPALRNVGTLGGNLLQTARCTFYNQSGQFRAGVVPCFNRGGSVCHKDESSKRCIRILMSEMAPPLIADGAEAVFYGPDGERIVSLAELYDVRLFKAKTKCFEILTQVRIPKRKGVWKECYERMAERRTIDYPAVNMGISVDYEEDGKTCCSMQLVIGSVGCGPFRFKETRKLIEGKALNEEIAEKIAVSAVEEITPFAVESVEFPTWYRLDIVKKIVRDALLAFTKPEYAESKYKNPPITDSAAREV